MADALHMFLMAASPLQLGGSLAAKAADAEPSSSTEAQPFAMQLAEAGEQPLVLTERQKAAAGTSLTDTVPAEAVNSEALQAILTDEQSSADEKDAARAWLAIIRAGQQEKAGITVLASSAKPAATSADEHLDHEALPEKPPGFAASVTVAARSGQEQQSETDKADSRLNARTETSLALSTAQAVAEEELPAGTSDTGAADEPLPTLNMRSAAMQAGALGAERTAAGTDEPSDTARSHPTQSTTESQQGVSAKVVSQNEADEAMPQTETELAEAALSSIEKTMSDVVAKNTGDVTASPAKRAVGENATSKRDHAVAEQESILQQQLQSDTMEITATSLPASAARSDSNSPLPSLATAVQARAEAQSNAAQGASQSGEQKSGEQKEQSWSGAMQQAQSEQSKAAAERFDASAEPEHVLNEEPLQRALNSQSANSLVGTGQSSTSPALATAASTAQVIQSQGSAVVQPASPSPTVSELLKQPLNLLAADASGQLRERLVMMVRNSVHSAEIKLDPAELGSMHIRVSMQQDQASVQFLVQQAHAKEILEEQLPKLRDMLGEQGIELADGQVSQQQPGQQQQQQTAGGNAMNEEDDSLMQEQRLPVAKPSNRLVDYYA